MQGVVESFDDHSGLGEVRAAQGGAFGFHCTELSDGSRHVAVGTAVEFRPAPGHLGRWEARSVVCSGPVARP